MKPVVFYGIHHGHTHPIQKCIIAAQNRDLVALFSCQGSVCMVWKVRLFLFQGTEKHDFLKEAK